MSEERPLAHLEESNASPWLAIAGWPELAVGIVQAPVSIPAGAKLVLRREPTTGTKYILLVKE